MEDQKSVIESAMRSAGEDLAKRYPGIGDDYRNGLTYEGIAEKYGIGTFGLSDALKILIPLAELHRLSLEHQQRGRENALKKLGHRQWLPEHLSYLFMLCDDREYQHQSGPAKGCPDYRKIKPVLEKKFGISRTLRSFGYAGSRRLHISKNIES